MVTKSENGYSLSGGGINAVVGEYGQLAALRLYDDCDETFRATNYVLNPEGAPKQSADKVEHEWFGELFLSVRTDRFDAEYKTSEASSRVMTADGTGVTVSYGFPPSLKLTERYEVSERGLTLTLAVENGGTEAVEVTDLGIAMPFNEYWTPAFEGEELYDTRVTAHSYVSRDSTYIYAQRPSGNGRFLLITPVPGSHAGFEYRDTWRERAGHGRSLWAQDREGWACGLYVYYIYSAAISRTGSGYLGSTSLTLAPGERREYGFLFRSVGDYAAMKRALYDDGVVDAVAVPGFAYCEDMDARFYLHVRPDVSIDSINIRCMHETRLYKNLRNCVSNDLLCKNTQSHVDFVEEKTVGGERYLVYSLHLSCLGVNHVDIGYSIDGAAKSTTLQFYLMESAGALLERRAAFIADTQTHKADGGIGDTVFDDWMMDSKCVREHVQPGYWEMSYWGWGDDWGYTHGEFLAEYASYKPEPRYLRTVDDYLETAIWRDLMGEHHDDFLVHDFLSREPNKSPVYRGYAYPHIYNTYLAMYRAAKTYPSAISYKHPPREYLRRAYGILRALYRSGQVAYNWETGLMGECTTPELIDALERESMTDEAADVCAIMTEKYGNFKNTKYPYGSEYFYDNTGEEAVYTLAAMNGNAEMMRKIDKKTRACRGSQPVWYYYAVPTTVCGEHWWNFQYTAALAGIALDENLRFRLDMSPDERANAQRISYAAKLANLTSVNSGQIDADPENIGAAAWTYQAVLGHLGGMGVGGGKLHNGWRQMAGEADLGLFGALRFLSADVARDEVFGLYGYGCDVTDADGVCRITPRDGLGRRLNFINEGVSLELSAGRIVKAEAAADLSRIALTVCGYGAGCVAARLTVTGAVYKSCEMANNVFDITLEETETVIMLER